MIILDKFDLILFSLLFTSGDINVLLIDSEIIYIALINIESKDLTILSFLFSFSIEISSSLDNSFIFIFSIFC